MTRSLIILVTIVILGAQGALAVDVADFFDNEKLASMLTPNPDQRHAFDPWETSFFPDENGDKKFTVTELKSWIVDAFFFPASMIVWGLWGTDVGIFFEITPLSFQSGATGVLAFIIWAFFWLVVTGQFSSNR